MNPFVCEFWPELLKKIDSRDPASNHWKSGGAAAFGVNFTKSQFQPKIFRTNFYHRTMYVHMDTVYIQKIIAMIYKCIIYKRYREVVKPLKVKFTVGPF
jgi:hypothetical protein